MCGLAGLFAFSEVAVQVCESELLRICNRMESRGPDGSGSWVSPDGRVALGHRRLAIIDLSDRAAQPMSTKDGRYRIVFNGEIYNFQTLRKELEYEGATFHSDSDTEVLLQLYATRGASMLRSLRGMFALAVWDSRDQELFLARDPFGIKPLYVSNDGQTLRFASQVRALVAGGSVGKEIDAEGALGYQIWGSVPEPHTIYKDIRSLEPGTWLRIRRGGLQESGQFESVAGFLQEKPSGDATAGTILHDVLLDSVRHHLIADVPVGVFLSGGIDSAVLAALAMESGHTLRTITMGFEEFRNTAADETAQAAQTAAAIGARHEIHWITRRDFEDAFDSFIASMDQPSIDGLNTWLVCRVAAKAGLKVVISGLGGDEFFGGYASFRHVPMLRRVARRFAFAPSVGIHSRRVLAPLVRKFTSEKYAGLLEYGSSWEGAYMLRRAVRMPWQVDRGSISPQQDAQQYGPLEDEHAIVSHLEATLYMRNQLLRDSDWASMAHSVELRVPLVDKEVTKYLARERGAGRKYTKQDLAAASSFRLPDEVTKAPKRGFSLPLREWLLARQPEKQDRGLLAWSDFVYENFMAMNACPATSAAR